MERLEDLFQTDVDEDDAIRQSINTPSIFFKRSLQCSAKQEHDAIDPKLPPITTFHLLRNLSFTHNAIIMEDSKVTQLSLPLPLPPSTLENPWYQIPTTLILN